MHRTIGTLKTGTVLTCLMLMSLAGEGCNDDDSKTPRDGGPTDAGRIEDAADGAQADGGSLDEVTVVGDRRVPFTPTNDRAFAEYFVEHHQMAVEMANHAAEMGADLEVKKMAARMAKTQTEEIATLKAALNQLKDTAAPPKSGDDPHSDADMARMMKMSGAELDQMFLLDMIAHHASALPTAHRAMDKLTRADLKALAQTMFEDQAREVGEMHAMLLAMGVNASGQDWAKGTERPDVGLVGDRRIPMTPKDDVEFIDFFVPHHAMAIEMAEAEVARGASSEAKAMAQMMLDMQTQEVETMRENRMKLAGDPDSPPTPADAHVDPEMVAMEQMSGAELDRMFLTEMIAHHASALPTAHRALPHVKEAELMTLATEMYNTQAKEIGEMRAMLDKLAAE